MPPMEMPFHLRKLPPEATDILRYFGANGGSAAHADDIIEGTGLTDRGFGKAIRRLVTNNYLVMDGAQVYRLSDSGRRSVAELLEYDLNTPPEDREKGSGGMIEPRYVRRSVMLVAPARLMAGQPTNIYAAIDEAEDDDIVTAPMALLMRTRVLHGEPSAAHDATVTIENRGASQIIEVTAGSYTQARITLEVLQATDEGSIEPCGGVYVDIPIGAEAGDMTLTAYRGTINVRDTSSADGADLDF
jgi:hypothetical protein